MTDEALAAVATAAGRRLQGETDEDAAAISAAAADLEGAVLAAMREGVPLERIVEAQDAGRDELRGRLGPEALRQVKTAARRLREADASLRHLVRRATRLGLSARTIAEAAGVTHGTVRAIAAASPRRTETGQEPTVTSRRQPPPTTHNRSRPRPRSDRRSERRDALPAVHPAGVPPRRALPRLHR